MVRLYGLKSCDTCRKARRALSDAGHEVVFVDLRDNPVDADQLQGWLDRLGAGLLNTRSTTWRGLDDTDRARPPLALLQAHPALTKRPVIDVDGALYLGWGKEVQAALLA